MYHPRNQIREEPPSAPPPASTAAYQSAFEELFGPDGQYSAHVKGAIISHPLFQQLLAAHVACLRVATPLDQQHVIDSALANRSHVGAKYLALVNHLQTTSHPTHDQELDYFMVEYILLLQSFKEQLQEHLKTQAAEAITACQEIERALFNLTGATSNVGYEESASSSMAHAEEEYFSGMNLHMPNDLGRLGINAFLPHDIQKSLREHVRRELKQELKEDYTSKLKEVRDEILRKRRAGKLPEDTTHQLKDWWLSHSHWPYPTLNDEGAQEQTGASLALETTLEFSGWALCAVDYAGRLTRDGTEHLLSRQASVADRAEELLSKKGSQGSDGDGAEQLLCR
ncbi:hypothetical protein GOP47_0019713 [Adiantum capillus-veneris]|uniref:ELK domain-containing protein n=1 Tax=Adiantum capillus-veneris TaxID=13818 RepID=A0A9D4Z7B3_ADICA|nr:hypothetical protein GOP47_0019713 [Adiantum capillus-veneris]